MASAFVNKNNIRYIIFCDQFINIIVVFAIVFKVPVIYNINVLIVIRQEGDKCVAEGFFNDNAGRILICKQRIVDLGNTFDLLRKMRCICCLRCIRTHR